MFYEETGISLKKSQASQIVKYDIGRDRPIQQPAVLPVRPTRREPEDAREIAAEAK
jgi:hypothetical protein